MEFFGSVQLSMSPPSVTHIVHVLHRVSTRPRFVWCELVAPSLSQTLVVQISVLSPAPACDLLVIDKVFEEPMQKVCGFHDFSN